MSSTRRKKTVEQLATAQFFRAGFGPKGTREWDYMRWAFAKGYACARRRMPVRTVYVRSDHNP